MNSLSKEIIDSLANKPKQLARDLGIALCISRKEINQLLYSMDEVIQDEEFRWSLSGKNMNKTNESTIHESVNRLEDYHEIIDEDEQTNLAIELDSTINNLTNDNEDSSDHQSHSKKFAFDSLEAIRKRLLDLTGRNSLLNFKHPKTSCIRLIDELPDQIYEVLQDGRKFTFISVPEPTEKELIDSGYIKSNSGTGQRVAFEYPSAEQWAKHLGFATSYDLPESNPSSAELKHQDTNLQTLFYGPELEARLRKISGTAESSIEESGANILYLALGFLEWYEDRESDVVRLSPLFTLPVKVEKSDIDRKAGAYRYTVQIKDDNLISNITLREKLQSDFGLLLPLIDDETTPESYFQQVRSTILKHQPRWKIRRQVSLVLLNFAKQAMYEDLDPSNWPEHSNIEDHPLIDMFFSSQGVDDSGDGYTYETEHVLDEIENVHEIAPLIYDADSSQHSAIVDVVSGKSLVIEGPPGSGKSQTITNIIAACIANGQSILFVAEKMAALNVVKNRLDRAQLGDFCLELHSHKTNKQKILNDLTTRLTKQDSYILPKEIDADIERYEDLKNKLNRYALKINTLWANTGLTIHEILQKATRLRGQFQIEPENLKIDGLTGENLTAIKQNELDDNAQMLQSIYTQVSEQAKNGEIKNHYWYGVNASGLSSSQIEELTSTLVVWSECLASLKKTWGKVLANLKLDSYDADSINEINQYVSAGLKLPSLLGGEQLDKLEEFHLQADEIKIWLENYENLHERISLLQAEIFDKAILSKTTISIISVVLYELNKLGVSSDSSLEKIASDRKSVLDLLDIANLIENSFQQILPNAPLELRDLFITSENNLSEVLILINHIEKLPTSLWKHRDPLYDNSELDELIESLTSRLNKISPLHNKLKDQVNFENLPSTVDLKNHESVLDNAGLFKWFSSEWRFSRKSVLSLSKKSKPNKSQFVSLLPEIISYSEQIDSILTVNNQNPALGMQFQGVDTPIHQITELRNWYKSIRAEYGIGFGSRVKIGSAILTLNREFAMALLDEANKGFLSSIVLLLSRLQYFQESYPNHALSKLKSETLVGEEGHFCNLAKPLVKALDQLSSVFKNDNITLKDIDNYGQRIKSLQQESDDWNVNEITSLIRPLETTLSVCPNAYSANCLAIVKNTVEISKVIFESDHIKAALLNDPSAFQFHQISETVNLLNVQLINEQEARKRFIARGQINVEHWLATSGDSIVDVIERNNEALSQNKWLHTWIDYIQLRNRLYEEGFKNLITVLEASQLKSLDIGNVVKLVIHHQLSDEIFEYNPDLVNFTGLEQAAIQQRFKEYDGKILKLQRDKVAFKASRQRPSIGRATGKVSEFSEVSLIKHEATKKSRHIAVRSLLKRSGSAIQTLKPCFMMSPMSVAQYLEPGKFKFDLVIMDEASQIRPEDALGAIARGTRLVVVGDPKQLPPTSFFNKVLEEEPEEELVGLQDSESILESVMPMFTNRRLRWHYRSKHESLIAFSNKNFYDSDLVIFPSPFKSSPEFGVKQHHVQRGRFSGGRNVEEAQEVVKSAAEHLINHPEESLGIVAMNAAQRDEIEKQLEQLAKDYPALLKAYDANKSSEEPLFIKNLENVQGDERDVIYISMTYGPEQIGGRTMQRFGPINSDVGWRRLNVLFTRSKKRMHIFSSMTSGDVLVAPTSSRGVKSLKAFLEYAETGHLHNTNVTGKSSDSDFEIAVMNMLGKHGYECEPQLGAAGFFLDIAVRDPGKPGKFLMGIECDGATYHSAKSARDRDHLRQEILESLGWKIRRIWSTDWFKHPQAQLQPILNELEKLRTQITEEPVFTDNDFNEINIQPIPEIRSISADAEQVFPRTPISIRERLLSFDRDVIRSEFPKTEESKRLLREEMLNVLLEYLPTSRAEFQEFVPSYLRTGTITYEAKFLDDVLGIIADYA